MQKRRARRGADSRRHLWIVREDVDQDPDLGRNNAVTPAVTERIAAVNPESELPRAGVGVGADDLADGAVGLIWDSRCPW
jgi:hypothetical protein